MNNTQILTTLENVGAILKGHFKLSSGLHSDTYIQCAKLFMYPKVANDLCAELAVKIHEQLKSYSFDLILSPAMGGILVGYELARHLNIPNIFCERVNGTFELRRGFEIVPKAKVLVVEDVVTTGKSSKETYDLIKSFGGEVVAEASIINRSGNNNVEGIPLVSLITLDVATYDPDNLPEHLKAIPVVKPGSRFLQTK